MIIIIHSLLGMFILVSVCTHLYFRVLLQCLVVVKKFPHGGSFRGSTVVIGTAFSKMRQQESGLPCALSHHPPCHVIAPSLFCVTVVSLLLQVRNYTPGHDVSCITSSHIRVKSSHSLENN